MHDRCVGEQLGLGMDESFSFQTVACILVPCSHTCPALHFAVRSYLINHEESKRQGKLKGKHLRHALNWKNVRNAYDGPCLSSTQHRCVVSAHAWCLHGSMVSKRLAEASRRQPLPQSTREFQSCLAIWSLIGCFAEALIPRVWLVLCET